MFDPATAFTIAATFLLAGAVKGVIGLGLPTVSLALLTVTVGLPQAMTLLLLPSFVTNLWQAVVGGHGGLILRRLWPFLLPAILTIPLGTIALARVNLALLSALLGALLVAYALINLAGRRFSVNSRHQHWVGPLAGLVNGLLTGMTGSFVVPGVLYLQAIGLSRDVLIQAMGVLFTASTTALAIALAGGGWISPTLGGWSVAAVVPAVLGMLLGQRVRRHLSERRFRQVFYLALLVLGCYLIAGAYHNFR